MLDNFLCVETNKTDVKNLSLEYCNCHGLCELLVTGRVLV